MSGSSKSARETGAEMDKLADPAKYIIDAIAVPIDSNTATAMLNSR